MARFFFKIFGYKGVTHKVCGIKHLLTDASIPHELFIAFKSEVKQKEVKEKERNALRFPKRA